MISAPILIFAAVSPHGQKSVEQPALEMPIVMTLATMGWLIAVGRLLASLPAFQSLLPARIRSPKMRKAYQFWVQKKQSGVAHPLHGLGRATYWVAAFLVPAMGLVAVTAPNISEAELSIMAGATVLLISIGANRGIAAWNRAPDARRDIAAFLLASATIAALMFLVLDITAIRHLFGAAETEVEKESLETLLYAVTLLQIPAVLWVIFVTTRGRGGPTAAGSAAPTSPRPSNHEMGDVHATAESRVRSVSSHGRLPASSR